MGALLIASGPRGSNQAGRSATGRPAAITSITSAPAQSFSVSVGRPTASWARPSGARLITEMLRWCKLVVEVIAMSSPYARDFNLLAKILAMRDEQLARLEARRERSKQVRGWRG